MGATSAHNTCGLDHDQCTGHFGRLELELPVFHPGYFEAVHSILRTVCNQCGRVLLPPGDRARCLHILRSPVFTVMNKKPLHKRITDTITASSSSARLRDGEGADPRERHVYEGPPASIRRAQNGERAEAQPRAVRNHRQVLRTGRQRGTQARRPGHPHGRHLRAHPRDTCGLDHDQCTGHFGRLELELPVFHPGYFEAVHSILRTVCKQCGRVKLPPGDRARCLDILRSPVLTVMNKKALHKRITDMFGVLRIHTLFILPYQLFKVKFHC
ncbi:hypothetical protein HPB48_020600 [Haemaphysalis longicornis]|uniref:DNA-directed RNA polymerase n=1 Tax=Haemaphysalis longicornis TaxID=44386 RepID=A0A9J6GLT2_HAELO|nr:hypothetical protein HPB48_020600 [Haemaphysalis longicornis]